jgi:hypothetical protein
MRNLRRQEARKVMEHVMEEEEEEEERDFPLISHSPDQNSAKAQFS